jgi:glycosyltransferase involved in cell wall biosynthesis
MSSNPFISIIIPNYNHAKFLNKRINSILEQSYTNYEIIILDDCSTDNSKEVIEKYRSNPKVSQIVYNECNSGTTFKQWEKGLNLSQGEYIWIAESDDYCDNNILETLANEIEKNSNVSIAYCSSQFVDINEKKLPPIAPITDEIKFYDSKKFIKEKMFFGSGIWNASSAIFKKSLAISIDKDYMNYKAAGDKLFWILLAEKGNVIYIKSPKNYFRQHDNKVSPRKLLDGTTSNESYKIFKYLKKKGYVDFFSNLRIREYYINELKSIRGMAPKTYKKLYLQWTEYGLLSEFIINIAYICYAKINKVLSCVLRK